MAEYIVEYPDDLVAEGYVEQFVGIHECIVRCKDCKYFYDFEDRCSKFAYDNGAIFVSSIVNPNGFCAWGERRK